MRGPPPQKTAVVETVSIDRAFLKQPEQCAVIKGARPVSGFARPTLGMSPAGFGLG